MKSSGLLTKILERPFRGIVGWFVLVVAALTALSVFSPEFRAFVTTAESPPTTFSELENQVGTPTSSSMADPSVQNISSRAFTAMLSLLGALAFAIPIVWVYTATRRQEGYNTSFVRMLVGLPVVVAGVVQIVSGDLALAFALAGIVAAVRFRTTVKDLQNAVFAFSVIGIGLATGAGSFLVALALAVVFCGVAYAVWRLEVGMVGPGIRRAAATETLADALVPGESHPAVAAGDEALVQTLAAEQVEDFTGVADRLAKYVRADALRDKGKYQQLIIIYTYDPARAEDLTEKVLEEHATRFVKVGHLTARTPGDADDITAPHYLLRLEKKFDVWTMLDQLECGPGDEQVIRAAQIKPIRGLRKWLT